MNPKREVLADSFWRLKHLEPQQRWVLCVSSRMGHRNPVTPGLEGATTTHRLQ